MASYIKQPNFNNPTRGQQAIVHRVEVLAGSTPALLQSDINAFLDGLPTAGSETPQIISVDYASTASQGVVEYTALVWYVLLG